MTSLSERIAQFRKMATDDPANDLAHFSLAKALMEDQQWSEAAQSFAKAVDLNPDFSKAYQLQGTCLQKAGQAEAAIEVLRRGFTVAHARGDRMPRDEMGQLLRGLGVEPPEVAAEAAAAAGGEATGFVCARPGCPAGPYAQPLPKPPMNDELGQLVFEKVCAACWKEWLGMGIKVINEMRLDLSDERSQTMYDSYMKEFLGLS